MRHRQPHLRHLISILYQEAPQLVQQYSNLLVLHNRILFSLEFKFKARRVQNNLPNKAQNRALSLRGESTNQIQTGFQA